MPDWLTILAAVSLIGAGISCLVIIIDLWAGHRQHMWIMNLVWPITALYAGPLALWAYFRVGRSAGPKGGHDNMKMESGGPKKQKPLWQSVALGATHCGSGCTLGDIVSEWFTFFVPLTLFGKPIFGAWVIDYILAFCFGIAFQYFTIKPMRRLSSSQSLVAALKADSLSLTFWQVGMYGWMAIATFVIFGQELPKTGPVFWFMLQIAMVAGFSTSLPITWWLLRRGIKERM
ncbi:MAG: DUF4396 domain-containing protein [Deltaproteobacteria bacterium]